MKGAKRKKRWSPSTGRIDDGVCAAEGRGGGGGGGGG